MSCWRDARGLRLSDSISRRTPPHCRRGAAWKLTIKALPARGEASGRLRVTAPDAPGGGRPARGRAASAAASPPPPPAWTLLRPAPQGASAGRSRACTRRSRPFEPRCIDARNGHRRCVHLADRFPQVARSLPVTGWAIAARLPDVPTLRYFGRLAEAIRSVDRLRTANEPRDRGSRARGPGRRAATG